MMPRSNRELLARLDREQDRIRDENEWQRLDPKEEAVAKGLFRDLRGSLPANAVLAILPANADPLAPRDDSRCTQFAERLEELAAEALRQRGGAPGEAPSPPGGDVFGEAICTGCRGSCCRSGGDHAYLTEETFLRVLHEHPEWTLADLRKAYLERLPAETVLDSCVYHSATGCGLPRDLRSETCNRHLCGKMKNLQSAFPAGPPPPVLGVFFDNGVWVRSALLDGTGCRVLSESGQE